MGWNGMEWDRIGRGGEKREGAVKLSFHFVKNLGVVG